MSDYFEIEERLQEALSYRRAHLKPLYNFSLGSSRWIRITFIVSPKVKILAIPVLLPIKSLIRIKILHYAGILKASIASAYLFITKQLTNYMWDSYITKTENDNQNRCDKTQVQKEEIVYSHDIDHNIVRDHLQRTVSKVVADCIDKILVIDP